MNRTSPFLLLAVLIIATAAAAQTRRKPVARKATAARPSGQTAPAKPNDTAAAATATSTTPPTSDSPAVAIVNDTTFTAADIDPTVTQLISGDAEVLAYYQDRAKAIRDARQRAVEARLSFMLISSEATKRKTTTDAFLDAEVNSRVQNPTDAEVRAVYDQNSAQLGVDLETARPQIIAYLRAQRAEKERADLVNRLKMTNTVQKGADVNAANLAPGTVLASVNGQPLRIETINERMKAYVYKMGRRIYDTQVQVLDRQINNTLILAEAKKKNIGAEVIMRTEVTDKLQQPTDAEIAKFYEENKTRITGDLASARYAIAEYLQQQQQQQLEADLATRLRAGAKVQILLQEPQAPIFNVPVGKGYGRGDINSAVKIVEFTDFQCAACGAMYPVMEEVLKSYGARVYFEIRNFPLTSLHANAFIAAEAAAAANAQGKLWPYIDFLFKNQSSLDSDSLKKYATQVGLDRKRFDADFESGKFDADIRRDIQEGETYGIEGTPTIYINGVILTTLSADALREAIEKAFTRK